MLRIVARQIIPWKVYPQSAHFHKMTQTRTFVTVQKEPCSHCLFCVKGSAITSIYGLSLPLYTWLLAQGYYHTVQVDSDKSPEDGDGEVTTRC
jgi:hypothetical protein